jgi:KaiC/GvpD/RAD55 family RecA-like ATPase
MSKTETRIPFGFHALDTRFDGMPVGSAVFLTGEPDAGPDAFAHTSAAMTMLARHDPTAFRSRIGTNPAAAPDDLPDTVTYVTLTRSRERVYSDLEATLDDEQYGVLTDHLSVADFSDEFLERTPIPESMFDRGDEDVEPGSKADDPDEELPTLLDMVSDYLADGGDDSLVIINSLTDIQRATEFGLDRGDMVAFLVGLRRATTRWNGLVYVIYHRLASTARDDEDINATLDGNIYFSYYPDRTTRRRTMSVGSFRGNIEKREEIMFETGITDSGFEIRTSRSIR